MQCASVKPVHMRSSRLTRVGVLLIVVSGNAASQEADQPVTGAEPARVISIVPRLSVTETFTNNATLNSNGKKSELISEISPGIQISSDRGRVRGFLDYSLRNLIYAQNTAGSTSQNALNSFGTLEAVSNFAYLDFNGSISQQAISAFGTQSPSNLNSNSNRTESRTLRLSPYLRGKLSTFADYEARYSFTTNRNGSLAASDATTNEASAKIRGQSTSASLGWSLDANRQDTSYSAGRKTAANSLIGNLSYSINPQVNLTVSGGREANNYTTLNEKSYVTSGVGISWIPSDVTRFSASRQNRSFGSSHSISAEHRTGRTAWRLNDSKDVSTTPSQSGSVGLGSLYDLVFSQFAVREPDPVLRASQVNSFLQVNGLNPNATVVSGFLTSAVTLQRRQDLSFVLLGVRDTVTFSLNRSEGLRLDTIVGNVNDDLSNGNVVRQRGLTVSYAHRLTPESTLNVIASAQRSADTQASQSNSTKAVNVSVSTRLGIQSTAILGARRVVFESPTTPYTESAITGTLNVQF
jgi:uncharacterized protein (PEP-CTERM system associated)